MNKKDLIQYITACCMLASGVTLAFLSFFICHDVTEGVLFYTAQCIVYAGSIFGISIYIKSKFDELKGK